MQNPEDVSCRVDCDAWSFHHHTLCKWYSTVCAQHHSCTQKSLWKIALCLARWRHSPRSMCCLAICSWWSVPMSPITISMEKFPRCLLRCRCSSSPSSSSTAESEFRTRVPMATVSGDDAGPKTISMTTAAAESSECKVMSRMQRGRGETRALWGAVCAFLIGHLSDVTAALK